MPKRKSELTDQPLRADGNAIKAIMPCIGQSNEVGNQPQQQSEPLKIIVKPDGDGGFKLSLPGNLNDADSLMRTAGSENSAFVSCLITQIADLGIRLGPGRAQKNVNFLFGVLHGLEPRNEGEALLISQMAASQAMAMKMMTEAAQTDNLEMMDKLVSMANKLMRTHVAQQEAFARLRGRKSVQKVIVEHVNVEAGGQAVVGAVQAGGPEG